MTPSAEENAATRKVIDLIVGMPPVIAVSALTRALATMIRESPIERELKVELARNLGKALIALVDIKATELPERPLPGGKPIEGGDHEKGKTVRNARYKHTAKGKAANKRLGGAGPIRHRLA